MTKVGSSQANGSAYTNDHLTRCCGAVWKHSVVVRQYKGAPVHQTATNICRHGNWLNRCSNRRGDCGTHVQPACYKYHSKTEYYGMESFLPLPLSDARGFCILRYFKGMFAFCSDSRCSVTTRPPPGLTSRERFFPLLLISGAFVLCANSKGVCVLF